MEAYGHILLFAMPAFLALVLFEKWWGWRKGFDTVRTMDMISSLSSGVTNVTKDVLGLAIAIGIYPFMVKYLAITSIENTLIVYILTFIIIDFNGYWVHRLSHHVNLFWNLHVIHHSSEEFNLACALRQSISSFFNLFTVLLLPAAILGIPEQVIAIVGPIQLFAQFWYHTRHINKMGFLEKILVTPSHHRVHHAVNPEYMDKNLSQIFIIWDKLFGTFQEELKEVPPVYGITRPARTWNPIRINFQHLWLMIKDAWHTSNWKDKFTLWFKPTGYRPADVAARYPVDKIEDVYHFTKYDTKTSPLFTAWSWIQLVMVLLFVSYLFGQIAFINQLDASYIYWYGAFVFLTVYAMTDLMDGNKYAFIWELLRSGLGLYFLFDQGDWFGLQQWSGMDSLKLILVGYFAMSLIVTLYLTLKSPAIPIKEFTGKSQS
ncbi:MAG: sterol desaturase family protein [Chitinophagaceae bacterium]|nr:sterol desaturase family protein [Chitinophagaceae bacterium]MBP6590567.1 sterol desaturase family protein [Chitinophagaceae bacterium]